MPMHDAEVLFHVIWGQAKEGQYTKKDWVKMHEHLLDLIRSQGSIRNGEVRDSTGKVIGHQG